jgi:tRNA pseudouridine55 synthase
MAALVQFFLHGDKEYEGRIRFGWATDTHDLEGVPLHPATRCLASRDEMERWVRAFQGRIRQRPPVFSAVKWQGESLHVYARRGQAVEARERVVTIHRLEILDWTPPELSLRVACSAGTYIRVLAHELGEKAGCGAHLAELRRTRSGPFTLGEAAPLADLESHPERIRDRLIPMESLLPEFPAYQCWEAELPGIRNGNELVIPLPTQPGETPDATPPAHLRILDPGGALLAVARTLRTEGGRLVVHPAIVLG